MGTMTLSVPNELKSEMDKVDWINWSSIARHAFVKALKDAVELKAIKRAREISEIESSDDRDFNEEYKKELLEITKGEHTKTLSSDELDKSMGLE